MSEDLSRDAWVKFIPPELKGIEGKILWRNGGHAGWYAVHVPYGDKGAVIYVPPTDVEPAGESSEPEEGFPIARIVSDIMTQHLGTLSLGDLKKLIIRTWAEYEQLSERDQLNVLRDVARRIYGGA